MVTKPQNNRLKLDKNRMKRNCIKFLVWLCVSWGVSLAAQDCNISRQSDSLALLSLFNSLEVKGQIYEWDFKLPLEQIDPISIKVENCRIVKLDLKLKGIVTKDKKFPVEVFNLTGLKELNLSDCGIEDLIPSQINNLTSLEKLEIDNCKLYGAIPNEICSLKSLKSISFIKNKLTGNIPDDLYNMKSLEEINFRGNLLEGSISPKIKNLSELKYLRIGDNKFSGLVPDEISECKKLVAISIQNNFFEKTIPSSIGSLNYLTYLNLENNLFTEIPILQNVSLADFLISYNKLTTEDILPIKRLHETNKILINFRYEIQDTVDESSTVLLNPGDQYILNTDIDKSIATNKRIWMRYGETLVNGEAYSYKINSYNNLTDKAYYHCVISNAELPGLNIIVKKETLNGKPQINTIRKSLCEGKYDTYENIIIDENHPRDTILLKGKAYQNCDSILILDYTFIPNSKTTISDKFCVGSIYTINNQQYKFPGLHIQKFKNYLGCDSTLIIYLEQYNEMLSAPNVKKNTVNSGMYDLDPNIYNNADQKTYKWSNATYEKTLTNVPLGIYKLTVTDQNGCIKEFSYNLNTLTSINAQELESKIVISPNPCVNNQSIEIQFEDDFNSLNQLYYTISNANGQSANNDLPLEYNQRKSTVQIFNLVPGVYILNIHDREGLVNFNKKIIIQ